eukprot:COSAG02_NODE_49496_length_326_cov_1.030837_1_plen_61_part_10
MSSDLLITQYPSLEVLLMALVRTRHCSTIFTVRVCPVQQCARVSCRSTSTWRQPNGYRIVY